MVLGDTVTQTAVAVIVPVYGNESTLVELARRVEAALCEPLG